VLNFNAPLACPVFAKKSADADAFTEKTEVFAKVNDTKEGIEVFLDLDTFTEVCAVAAAHCVPSEPQRTVSHWHGLNEHHRTCS